MPKHKLILLDDDRAIIEMQDDITPEKANELRESFRGAWERHDLVILSRHFEVIDRRKPDIEKRLAAVEEWIRKEHWRLTGSFEWNP